MSELQWARGIGDEWSLAVEVPGVRKLHPVSDLVACLRANPEARDAVLREFADDEQWSRALVEAKARAETAERALADLHKLIHEQSGLDDHRYSPEQMVTEMAQRWQGASDDCEKAERERDEARDRAERLEVQLAGCGSAALGYAGPECKPGDYGYSASYGDVLALHSRIAKLEADLASAMAERDDLDARFNTIHAKACEYRRERDEARAALADAIRSRIAKLEAAVTAVSEWREMGAYLPPFVVRALDEQDSGGPATVEVPVTTEPRGDGTREDAPSAGQAGSSPLRTLDPKTLAEALKTAKLDICPRYHGSRTVGAGYIVGGLREPGQRGGPHEPRIPCPACAQDSGGSAQDTATIVDRLVAAKTGAVRRYVTRAEVAEMVAEACERGSARRDMGALLALAAELRKGVRKTIGGGA